MDVEEVRYNWLIDARWVKVEVGRCWDTLNLLRNL